MCVYVVFAKMVCKVSAKYVTRTVIASIQLVDEDRIQTGNSFAVLQIRHDRLEVGPTTDTAPTSQKEQPVLSILSARVTSAPMAFVATAPKISAKSVTGMSITTVKMGPAVESGSQMARSFVARRMTQNGHAFDRTTTFVPDSLLGQAVLQVECAPKACALIILAKIII